MLFFSLKQHLLELLHEPVSWKRAHEFRYRRIGIGPRSYVEIYRIGIGLWCEQTAQLFSGTVSQWSCRSLLQTPRLWWGFALFLLHPKICIYSLRACRVHEEHTTWLDLTLRNATISRLHLCSRCTSTWIRPWNNLNEEQFHTEITFRSSLKMLQTAGVLFSLVYVRR